MMILNDLLKIGEVREVYGHKVKAGVYAERNSEYLNYNGKLLKNVSIGSFVLIRKGYLNIIGKVEGESIKETKSDFDYEEKGRNISRILDISILGSLGDNCFQFGLVELPMIGNLVYIIDDEVLNLLFDYHSDSKIKLGSHIEYDSHPFELDVQNLICSHIGIFGNTGSGKSNTLAKIYTELFNWYGKNDGFVKNSKFFLFDLNGEFRNTFSQGDYYDLLAKSNSKYPLNSYYLTDTEFWSVVLQTSEKTQKPFINKCINNFVEFSTQKKFFSADLLSHLIFDLRTKYLDVKQILFEFFELLNLKKEILDFDDKVYWNKVLYFNSINTEMDAKEIQRVLFGNSENRIFKMNEESSSFHKFKIIFYFTYCFELSKGKIQANHINQLFSRADKVFGDLDKVFEIDAQGSDKYIEIISLVNLDMELKKLVTYLICKDKYRAHKQKKGYGKVSETLHFIIEEAHNILSPNSVRESEEWKDYRMETFEEFIKEGRKFGVFLTLSSQRPSDISSTIMSQLHNFFIHRMVNSQDLYSINTNVSFLDETTNAMIPILPCGGCLFSGTASNFPILAKIDQVHKSIAPNSENVSLKEIWNLK